MNKYLFHHQPKRSSWQIMCDSVFAFYIRELKTRFGSNKQFGYFWSLAEPIAQAAFVSIFFTMLDRKSVASIPISLFLFTGVLPFQLFRKIFLILTTSVDANKSLLCYKQVAAIDFVIARIMVEFLIFFLVTVTIFLFLAYLGFDTIPNSLLELLLAIFLLVLLATGLGLILCCAVNYWPDCNNFASILMKAMFFMSGVVYCAQMVPTKYYYLIEWNPMLHAIEIIRDSYFESYTTPLGSWKYLGFWGIASFYIGLALFHANRIKFVTK